MAKHALKRKLRAGHILSALFLFYIFYVGLAALPQLLVNTSETLRNGKLNSSYIKKVNDQYEGMLGTESWYPLLQNKGTYINFNGLMAKKLGQPLMNERITLKNGHLFYVDSKTPDPEEILHAADNIIRFHDAHTASGGNFLFVMVPSQISKYEDLLPAGYTDTTNDTADAFLSLLEQAGVPYLDLREEMHKDGLTVTDDYYSTDHHWKPQTGFWAYTKILKSWSRWRSSIPWIPFTRIRKTTSLKPMKKPFWVPAEDVLAFTMVVWTTPFSSVRISKPVSASVFPQDH